MAKYISIGSKFKPFSYQELIAPVLMALEQHSALEELYGTLASLSDTLENLLSLERESGAYNMYKKYSDSLASSADILSKEGLTPGSRKALIDMKSRYAKEITPIQNAYTRRDQLSKELRELRGRDSSMIFNKDIAQTSLDEFIKNPSLLYQGYSGNQLTQLAGQAAQALSKAVRNDPRKWNTILGGQYFQTKLLKGYTPEEVIASAAGDPKAPQELRDIIDQVYKGSGIGEWGNLDASLLAYNSIARGLYQSIGDVKYDMVANQEYADMLRRRAAKEKEVPAPEPRQSYKAIPRTTVDGKTDTDKLNEDIAFVQRIMTDKNLRSKKETKSVMTMKSITAGGWSSTPEVYTPNESRMAGLENKYGTKDPNKIIQEMQKETAGTAIRDFQYGMNLADNTLMAETIRRTATAQSKKGKSPMYEYEDGVKGNRAKTEDLLNINSRGNLIYDPKAQGFIYDTLTEDGEKKTYLLDVETLDDPDRTIKGMTDEIDKAFKEKRYSYANAYILEMMSTLDAGFNTLAKALSNTDAKLSFKAKPEDFTQE